MGNQRRFWLDTLKRAFADFRKYISSARDHLMGMAIQLAVAFLVLRYVPGLGEFRAQVNDAVLFALAVLATGFFQFVAALLAAPGRIYADVAERVDRLEIEMGRDADLAAIKAKFRHSIFRGFRSEPALRTVGFLVPPTNHPHPNEQAGRKVAGLVRSGVLEGMYADRAARWRG